jgi:hypothetical protein
MRGLDVGSPWPALVQARSSACEATRASAVLSATVDLPLAVIVLTSIVNGLQA